MPDIKWKILILGESQVGKTSLVIRFTEDRFTKTKTTIGVAFAVKHIYSDDYGKIRLQVWDFAGEERFRTLLGPFCMGASGAILLYDLSNPITFSKLDFWIPIVKNNTAIELDDRENKPIPLILAGSKKDLINNGQGIVDEEKIQHFMKKHEVSNHYEISSKTGENVELLFKDLVNEIAKAYEMKGMRLKFNS